MKTWISPRDLAQLVRIGLEHPDIEFEMFYAVSNNMNLCLDNTAATRYGYKPQSLSASRNSANSDCHQTNDENEMEPVTDRSASFAQKDDVPRSNKLSASLHDDANAERIKQLEIGLTDANLRIERALGQIAILERQFARGWLRFKFSQKLMVFEQYAPRVLKIPQSYENVKFPDPSPRFAIVTPSFNQGHFLSNTIESVLGQRYPNLDYHVQDACSSDNTTDLLKRFEPALSWASAPDDGQADGVNSGFASVDGDIMAYLNGDDLLMPGTLAYVARFFADHPDVDIVYGHRIFIDAAGQEIGRAVLPRHDGEALKWFDYVPQETLFWRRRVWTALGGLDKNFQFAMDWDFILRAQAAGMKFRRLPRFLGCFRVHSRQKSTALMDVGATEMSILRKRSLGSIPSERELRKKMKPYLARHVIAHRLYKLRLLKY